MLLPDLIERISPAEGEVYAGEQNVRQTAVSTTATDSDYLILCDCSAGGIIVSLVSATKAGKTLVIVRKPARLLSSSKWIQRQTLLP
jgi:adenine/guanine phosphoribosyltransferase-like PRPP-binding protein